MTTTDTTWPLIELGRNQPVTPSHIRDLLEGRIAAIRIPEAVDPQACAEVVRRIETRGTSKYPGMREALGTLFPNHWSARYVDGDWDGYFASVDSTEDVKAAIFEPLGMPPREVANRLIEPGLGRPVERLRCPQTGRPYHSVIVRAGAAKHHFDFGGYDLPSNIAPRVMRQCAWNIYLSAEGAGGELEVFQTMGTSPGHTKAKAETLGIRYFGNYDLPAAFVEGAPSVAVACRTGDFVMIMNRHVHRVRPVVPTELTERRIAISSHVAEFIDGRFCDFS